MKLTADFHTHTKYSHGKGSVLENALVAKRENKEYNNNELL